MGNQFFLLDLSIFSSRICPNKKILTEILNIPTFRKITEKAFKRVWNRKVYKMRFYKPVLKKPYTKPLVFSTFFIISHSYDYFSANLSMIYKVTKHVMTPTYLLRRLPRPWPFILGQGRIVSCIIRHYWPSLYGCED